MGKMTAPSYPPSNSTPASRPAELLHADIVFIAEGSRKMPHLALLDDFSDFLMLKRLPTKSASDVTMAFQEMFNQWTAWGHPPYAVRTDPENVFRACQSSIHALGIRTQFAAVGAHEKKVERVIRTLRERVRVMALSLKFPLPSCFNQQLFLAATNARNCLPTFRSSPRTPFHIATGEKVDMKAHFRAPFGTLAVFRDPNPSDDSNSRGQLGIVLTRDSFSRGSVRAFLLDSETVVSRATFKVVQMTDDVIERLRVIALKSPVPPRTPIYQMLNGNVLEDRTVTNL
jgi:hypothetical protein